MSFSAPVVYSDVAGGDQGGPLVDGRREVVELDRQAIGRGHHDQLHPERGARQPLMPDRREVEGGGHHPRARSAAGGHARPPETVERGRVAAVDRVERGGDDRERRADVRGQGDLVTGNAENRTEVGAQLVERPEPSAVPGARPELVPVGEERIEPAPRALGSGAERAGVQVDRRVEQRELGAIREQLRVTGVGQWHRTQG